MNNEKNLFYDVSGREDEIYLQHFKSDGYTQDWIHFHSKYELSLVLNGEVNILSNGRVYHCDKPHFQLHRPYAFHAANSPRGGDYECFVFYFTEESLRIAGEMVNCRKLYAKDLVLAPLEGDSLKCARSLAEMTLLDGLDDGMRAVILVGLLVLAEKKTTQTTSSGAKSASAPVYIAEVLEYINANYPKKLTAAEIAKRFFVSEQKLNLDFKKYTSETLHHYLMTVKITRAAGMIARGKSPMSAAIDCGFVDETHFAKTFKARIGLTPYQYRKTVESRIEYVGDYDEKNTTPR